ncbi:MAG: TlpA family protein disulfide reductase [Nitrospirae bacterium]|nr:TlpA family protein disulfide reductase [Nitrospirota bacterium]
MSKHFYAAAVALLLCVTLSGCGGMTDDLNPSGTDKSPHVTAGTIGNQPGQKSEDFTLPTTDGGTFKLSDHLTGGATPADAVVLYFTMWCPACSSHMDHIQIDLMPFYKNAGKAVRFVAVDYLNAVDAARNEQQMAGYDGSGFIVAVDTGDVAEKFFRATMGTTVVIDKDGVVRMNEDFKDGEKLKAVLSAATGE